MLNPQVVKDALDTNTELTAQLTGKIWTRGLKRRGPFATPDAFASAGAQDLKPAAIITAIQRRRQPSDAPGTYNGFVTVWLKAKETTANTAALEEAAELIIETLHDSFLEAGDGTFAEFTLADHYGVRSDPVIPGDLVDYVQFAIAGLIA